MKTETLSSGLVVPVNPPTDEERRASRIAEMEAYYLAHACCPTCGASHLLQTTAMGVVFADGYRDTNRAWCGACEWVGVRHDCVPQDNPGSKP